MCSAAGGAPVTESDWLATDDLTGLTNWVLRRRASQRRLRLYACAACRRVEPFLTPKYYQVLEAAEALADGAVSPAQLKGLVKAAEQDLQMLVRSRALSGLGQKKRVTERACSTVHSAAAAPRMTRQAVSWASAGARLVVETCTKGHKAKVRASMAEHSAVCGVFKDIFGNPFRPVAFDPRWRSADVLGLAQAAYDNRAFDRLPLLADALMDAGCADEDILGHCRGAGLHVRGCWVVDLVLAKA
jgi:hypothetical protein